MGFKENVIMGHIIPGGTGFEKHKTVKRSIEREHQPLVFNFAD
jgi:DNA-directed RNA polymerase subunit beta'